VLSCHNPTFIAGHPDENCLAKIAPPPPPCDKNGAGPCAVDSNLNPTGKCVNLNTATGQGTGAKSHGGGSGSGGGGPSNPSGPSTGTSTGNNLVLPGGTSTGTNPLGGVGGTGQGGPGLQAAAVSTTEPRSQSPSLELGLEILAAALLLGLLIAPPLVAQRFKGK
jgi:hypothetical protein